MEKEYGDLSSFLPVNQDPKIEGEMEYAQPMEPPRFKLPVDYGSTTTFNGKDLDRLYGGPYRFEERIGDIFATKDKNLPPKTVAGIVGHSNKLVADVYKDGDTFGSEDAENALLQIYEQLKSKLGVVDITAEQRQTYLDQMYPTIPAPPTQVDPNYLNSEDVQWNQRLAAQNLWRGGDLFDTVSLLFGPRQRAMGRQQKAYEIENKNREIKANRAKTELDFLYDDQKEKRGVLEKIFGEASGLIKEREKIKGKQILPKELDIAMNKAMASDATVDNVEKKSRWQAVETIASNLSRSAQAVGDYDNYIRYGSIAEFARSQSAAMAESSTAEKGRTATADLKKVQASLAKKKTEYIPKQFAEVARQFNVKAGQRNREIANATRRVNGYLQTVSIMRQAAADKTMFGHYNLKYKTETLNLAKAIQSGKFTKEMNDYQAKSRKMLLDAALEMESIAAKTEESSQASELRTTARAYRRAAAGQELTEKEKKIVGDLVVPADIDMAAGEILSTILPLLNQDPESSGEDDGPGNFPWP